MAYVDSKMARLREAPVARENAHASGNETESSAEAGPGVVVMHRQPAGLGKLQEIDLGPDAILQNIARTEEATRRLQHGHTTEHQGKNPPSKPRLGKDGKPMRRRNRRTSDDVKRDQLVEQVLKESKCKVDAEGLIFTWS